MTDDLVEKVGLALSEVWDRCDTLPPIDFTVYERNRLAKAIIPLVASAAAEIARERQQLATDGSDLTGFYHVNAERRAIARKIEGGLGNGARPLAERG